MPVVSAPTAAPQDEELTFTCTSKDGYPRPNVYWINRTDNSLLDEALQNSTVSLNARGLYDVVSVLRIRRTPHVNVGCCIENVLLHQNLTVSSQKGGGKDLQACPNHGSGPGVMGDPLRRLSPSEVTRQRHRKGGWKGEEGRVRCAVTGSPRRWRWARGWVPNAPCLASPSVMGQFGDAFHRGGTEALNGCVTDQKRQD